jgi:hypothetical protein
MSYKKGILTFEAVMSEKMTKTAKVVRECDVAYCSVVDREVLIEQLKKSMELCMISLLIEEKVRAGDPDIAKFLKAYDDLTKISNFTPKDVKDADEFDSSGEVYAYLEKTGFKPKIY